LWVTTILYFFYQFAKIFFCTVQRQNNVQFCEICGCNKYFVGGSGIREGQKSGFGIIIPNLQRCKHHHARHFGMLFGHYSYEGAFTTNISLSYSYYTMSKIGIPSGEKYILAEQRKIKKFNMVHLACFLKKRKTEN
jgi:hypothetical protein